MGWKDDDTDPRAIFSQDLIRDDDLELLGFVLRHATTLSYGFRTYKCGNCDHYHAIDLGSFPTDDAAKLAVENSVVFSGDKK